MEFDIYFNGKCSKNDDLYFLRFFREYQLSSQPLVYHYFLEDPRLASIRERTPDNIIYDSTDEFDLQCNLMHWIHQTLISGDDAPVHPFNTLNILDNIQNNHHTASCWTYAIALNEVFLSHGFLSRMVRCLPLDLRPFDCHCVTLVYSNIYRKWIVFDAAMGTFYTSKDKIPLSLKEMRNAFIQEEPVMTPFIPKRASQNLRWYLIKNFIRFQSYQVSCFNMEEHECENVIYTLNPLHFKTEDKVIYDDKKRPVLIKNIYSENDFWS